MRWNKKQLSEAQLYLILDTEVLGSRKNLLWVLKIAVRCGVDIVQLRSKKSAAKEILDFSREILKVTKHQIPFIVNDRVDLAILAGADGVHLGQDDMACDQARRLMGPHKIIGVSAQSLAAAQKAQRQGADYIGFGSVFKTKTKPDRRAMDLKLLQRAKSTVKIPLFAIGGIGRQNVQKLLPLGVNRIAVCRDILLAHDVGEAVRALKGFLNADERKTKS